MDPLEELSLQTVSVLIRSEDIGAVPG